MYMIPFQFQSLLPGKARLIPSFHHRLIYNRDDRAVVQIYLSFFPLSKVVIKAKKIDRSLFESMVAPPGDMESIMTLIGNIKGRLRALVTRYMPWIPTISLLQGMTWEPTW